MADNMKCLANLVVCLLLILSSIPNTLGHEGGEEGKKEREERRGMFLLKRSREVVRTKAGEMRVMRGYAGKNVENPMHIGFINMEPNSLFLPQYLDSSIIIFLRQGEAKIGWINKDQLAERALMTGDLYRIPAGSAFYIVNTGEGQRLQMVCSIDTTESLATGSPFQSFFVGGGRNPMSVLSGFDQTTLTTAFNVSSSQLTDFMTRQRGGPIVFINTTDEPRKWASFMELKYRERLEEQCGVDKEDDECNNEKQESFWKKFVNFILGRRNKNTMGLSDAYNIYDRNPDFQNNYGSSRAVDRSDYPSLRHGGIGVYFVNLTAGAMMAPHMNPTATEYGVVLRGSGSIQVVYPNGSLAMNTNVKAGDVFWVPRYFPFCQIASHDEPMELFGFTTSARKNRPQFLAGASSLLRTMRGPELAEAFSSSEERLAQLIDAQRESIILPTASVASLEQPEEAHHEKSMVNEAADIFERFGSAMIMDFD